VLYFYEFLPKKYEFLLIFTHFYSFLRVFGHLFLVYLAQAPHVDMPTPIFSTKTSIRVKMNIKKPNFL